LLWSRIPAGWNLKSFGGGIAGPVVWIVDATFASVAPVDPKASTPDAPLAVELTMMVEGRVVIVADPPEAKMPLEKLPAVKLIVPPL